MIDLVSLFSGAGGLDYAFEMSGGYRSSHRVEMESAFCETLEFAQRNGLLSSSKLHCADLRALDANDLRIRKKNGGAFGVIGGPPCETYSNMGRGRRCEDSRGSLVFDFASTVDRLAPDFFLMENVPTLLRADDGRVIKQLLAAFEDAGFDPSWQVLNAADFGAATLRKRLLIVGIRNRKFDFPSPTHGDPAGYADSALRPWTTVRDAFMGLPPPKEHPPSTPSEHVLVRHTPAVQRRFGELRQGQFDKVRRRSRLSWARPSPCLVAGNLAGTRSHIHPDQPRELTNRESARIHGFPDAYEFGGTKSAVGKQIANSVPVGLGMAIAVAIREQLGG